MATLEKVADQQATSGTTIDVLVRHSGIEKRIIGQPDSVLRELLSYVSTILPAIDIVSKVVLNVDSQEFLASCAGNVAATPEGLAVLKDISQLKDRELLMLYLAGARLLLLLGKRDNDAVTLEELTRMMGRPTGTVAGRLSELWKEQLVERVGKGSYRLTTMGTRIVMRNVMPRLNGAPEK